MPSAVSNAAANVGPVRVGQAVRLLVGQRELPRLRVVFGVSAGGLPAQPLGEIALVAAGAFGELFRVAAPCASAR